MPDTAETRLPPELLQAYLATHYRLHGMDWQLQIGQAQPALLPYYQRHAVQSAAYLTACNPLGQPLSNAANQERMAQLRTALQRAGWAWLEGQGCAANHPEWPAEDSVLVWGMDRSTAKAWGRQWEQNAIVYCGANATPELVLLR